jgi:ATP-binding cassette, subfamily B, bacterial HlyB/CyaB
MNSIHAIAVLLRQLGVDSTPADVAQAWAKADPPTPKDGVHLFKKFAIKSAARKLSFDQMLQQATAIGDTRAPPALLFMADGDVLFLAGAKTDGEQDEIVLADPAKQGNERFSFMNRDAFKTNATGWIILAKSQGEALEVKRFGLGWFVDLMKEQGWAFRDVAIAVAILHIIGLATPIFFQLVIDRVVVHQVQSTLIALGIGVIIALIFEAILSYLKGYLLVHATAKIDIKTATYVFSRLLSLPIGFFETSPAGVLVQHIQQDKRVREFLTGRVFLTFLDSTAILIYLPLLLFYSPQLTGIVLASALLLVGGLIAVIGPFQKLLHRQYKAQAKRQALLVETTHGISTVKSLSLEPARLNSWNDVSGEAVLSQKSVGIFGVGARSLSTLVERLTSVAIIWVGVYLLFEGKLTIGELVAFQMLSARVSGPLVSLAGLIHEAQESLLSLRMLAGVMNVAPEPGFGRGLRAPVRGAVSFEAVSFRYPNVDHPALDNVSFSVPAGAMVGVVGRSGSGKTTLVRLLQSVLIPSNGLLKVDGHDLREYEKAAYRRQISVVPQESFLFAGSVRDNIALGFPAASVELVAAAARRAGAEEFIQRLPAGYETSLEEGASNLSGGQKQRLALARAILRDPRILILDEATSALDPESELIIQKNLGQIVKGRTTFILSHRLSLLIKADAIIVMDQGKLVDIAPHAVLLERCAIYRHLWTAQAEPYTNAPSKPQLPSQT